MSKLFEDMLWDERLAHIERCQVEAVECIRLGHPSNLADIADHVDYWGPWMLAELRKQTQLIKMLRAEAEAAQILMTHTNSKNLTHYQVALAARLKLEDEMT